MRGADIERLIQLLAKLPGLGPRSARRAALYLLKRKEALLEPLAEAMVAAAANVRGCSICRNLDTTDPCAICANAANSPADRCMGWQNRAQYSCNRGAGHRCGSGVAFGWAELQRISGNRHNSTH